MKQGDLYVCLLRKSDFWADLWSEQDYVHQGRVYNNEPCIVIEDEEYRVKLLTARGAFGWISKEWIYVPDDSVLE